MVDEKEFELNPDMIGEYNVARTMAAFNKRIEPLLVVFKLEIRDEILIEDPKDRPIFTKSQTELDRGTPKKEKDQDNLDEVLTLSDMELEFWQLTSINPYYMYIDNTIDLVDGKYVKKNLDLMKTKVSKTKINDDETYEFDSDGDLMSLVFD